MKETLMRQIVAHSLDDSHAPPDGYPTVASVKDAVESALMEPLWAALDFVSKGYRFNGEIDCIEPGCTTETADGQQRSTAYRIEGTSKWGCDRCGKRGTIFGLRRAVLEDAKACDALMKVLAEPEPEPEPEPVEIDPWEAAADFERVPV
jgi:hypothetical protein